MKIRFWIRKNKTNQSNKAPLYCYITVNKKRCSDFSTGLIVKLEEWDSKSQTSSNSYIQMMLDAIRNELEIIEIDLIKQGKQPTTDEIKQRYFNKETNKPNIVSFFEKWLEKQQKEQEKEEGTIKSYKNRYRLLVKYLEHLNKKQLTIEQIDIPFANKFVEWIKTGTETTRSLNYAMKNVQTLKQLLKYAVQIGELKYNPLSEFEFKFSKKKRPICLDDHELASLERHKFSSKYLQRVADLAIFQCYTGLAYADYYQFSVKDTRTGIDGRKWIDIQRQKTGTDTLLPLFKRAEKILIKYDYQLHKISNQKYNAYLKEIGEILGIEKKLTTHMLRRTFGMIMLNKYDVPIETVSRMLGHKSVQITQQCYAYILEKKIAKDVKRVA